MDCPTNENINDVTSMLAPPTRSHADAPQLSSDLFRSLSLPRCHYAIVVNRELDKGVINNTQRAQPLRTSARRGCAYRTELFPIVARDASRDIPGRVTWSSAFVSCRCSRSGGVPLSRSEGADLFVRQMDTCPLGSSRRVCMCWCTDGRGTINGNTVASDEARIVSVAMTSKQPLARQPIECWEGVVDRFCNTRSARLRCLFDIVSKTSRYNYGKPNCNYIELSLMCCGVLDDRPYSR